MRVLVTNDDGYSARGIKVLARAARALGEVFVVAPDREQSAASHAITLHQPLRARRTPEGWWAVTGTPVDSVILGMAELLPGPPKLCLSGINRGPNMGEDVLYSGTVSAAMEATINNIPAIAISHGAREGHARFDEIDEWEGVVTTLLAAIVEREDFPAGTLLNVNLPAVAPSDVRGCKVTELGCRRYEGSIHRRVDPSGRELYWLGGGELHWDHVEGSDFCAVDDGYISVSPVHLNLTHHDIMEEIRGWDLTL